VLLGVVIIRSAWVAEDAYITFRTVDNFIHGHGLTWNTSERVQAFTHPLWMFVVSLFCLFTREVFYTSILLGFLASMLAVVLYAFKLAKTQTAAIVGVLTMMFSKAFVDYSTSGMENPITHLLLVLFLIVYFGDRSSRKTLFLLSLITALAAFNRLDTILLFLPGLIYYLVKGAKPTVIGAVVAGFAPLLIWEAFAIVYYGFPFPNSAYAKLNTGIPRADLVVQGFHYVKNSLLTDPLTLAAIAFAIVLPILTRKRRDLPLVGGMLLYVLYVVFVGGDFMSGRFLTAPFVCAVVLISRNRFDSPKTWLPAAVVVAVTVVLSYPPTILSGTDYPSKTEGLLDDRGIADERGYYFQSVGLFRSDGEKGVENQRHAIRGREALAEGKRFTYEGNVGFFGYYAGPDMHIVDGFALADPLLARLPVRSTEWRIGHFVRDVPDGYLETVTSGENRIRQSNIANYYDRLSLITRRDLFDGERLSVIWKMNTGQYDRYVKPLFESRHHQDIGIRLFEEKKITEAIDELRKSVALDSTQSAAWVALARAYREVGNLELARPAMIKATELEPKRYAGELRSLAIFHGKNGDVENGIALYEKLSELVPISVQVQAELAYLYERLGRLDDAIAAYERGLALDPDNGEIETRLQNLKKRLPTP